MWYLWLALQMAVMIAVLWTNIYWQFTPNNHLVAIAGVAAAFGVTWFLSELIDDWRNGRYW